MFDRIRTAWANLRSAPIVADAPANDLGSMDVRNGLGRDEDDARPFGECPPLTATQARIVAGTPEQHAAFLRGLGLTAATDPATGRVRFRDAVPVDGPIGFVPTQLPRGADTKGTPPPVVPTAPRGPFADWDDTAVEAGFLGITPDDTAATITLADIAWLASQRDGGAR